MTEVQQLYDKQIYAISHYIIMTVYFMCKQFYVSTWLGMGYPDIWLKIILEVSIRVYLREINM